MKNVQMQERWNRVMQSNYGSPTIALDHGQGVEVWDVEGKRYLDFLAGIATNLLGHNHPAVAAAITRQATTLSHVSNFYSHEPGVALAEKLVALVGTQARIFFCNSGAEANEAAFKLSRLTGRSHVVSTINAFHGRTMGALALTGQPTKADPFRPLPGEVTFTPYGDISALRASVTSDTAMVIIEPIQGEGGVIPAPPGYLQAARDITLEQGALLVFDEVQTGMGRTGSWFAHQHDAVVPDVITMAKGIGAGLPLGAMIAVGASAELFRGGMHGSTFGGNPICCAAGLAAIHAIESEGLLENARARGEEIVAAISEHRKIAEVRGKGLLLGVKFHEPIAVDLQTRLQNAGFLTNAAQPDVLRLAPPLIVTREQVEEFTIALKEIL